MITTPVLNAWHLLADVRQRLAAGETRVVCVLSDPPHGPAGTWATDEHGTRYDLADELKALFGACLDTGLTCFLEAHPTRPGQPLLRTLAFGQNPPPAVALPELIVQRNLAGYDVRIEEIHNPANPARPILRIDLTPLPDDDPDLAEGN